MSYSIIEPMVVNDALQDEHWANAMDEELEQFARNDVWELIVKPNNVNCIGAK